MSYTLKKLPGEPIIIQKLHSDYSLAAEGEQSIADSIALLDAQPEQVYYIVDLTDAHLSVNDVIQGANLASRQTQVLKHPKIRANLFITTSPLVSFAAKGMNSPAFGGIKIEVYSSTDEALAAIRAQRSK